MPSAGACALRREPREQPADALPLGVAVEQLGEMQQVRRAPLAVAVLEQPQEHVVALDERRAACARTRLVPFAVRFAEGLDHLLPARSRRARSACSASPVTPIISVASAAPISDFAAGLRDRREHALELFGFARREDALGAALHARDAERRERVAHRRALPVAAHEHRDVAAAQSRAFAVAVVDARRAARAELEQARDLGRGRIARPRVVAAPLLMRLPVVALRGARSRTARPPRRRSTRRPRLPRRRAATA